MAMSSSSNEHIPIKLRKELNVYRGSLSGVKDTAGNAVTPTGSTTSITVGYDGTAPTVTASTPASRVNADFVVTFTFNEPLENGTFTNSDIAITGTGTATVHSGPTKSNTDAKVYTATIRPSVAGTAFRPGAFLSWRKANG